MWGYKIDHLKEIEERIDEAERRANDGLKSMTAELSAQKSAIASLSSDIKRSANAELLERIESLERRLSSLHSLLTEKSPATGAERLSKTGKNFKKFFI